MTMLPRPRAVIRRAAARETWKTPSVLTAKTAARSASSRPTTAAPRRRPATLTAMSSGPRVSSTSATAGSTAVESTTSRARAVTRSPCPRRPVRPPRARRHRWRPRAHRVRPVRRRRRRRYPGPPRSPGRSAPPGPARYSLRPGPRRRWLGQVSHVLVPRRSPVPRSGSSTGGHGAVTFIHRRSWRRHLHPPAVVAPSPSSSARQARYRAMVVRCSRSGRPVICSILFMR